MKVQDICLSTEKTLPPQLAIYYTYSNTWRNCLRYSYYLSKKRKDITQDIFSMVGRLSLVQC